MARLEVAPSAELGAQGRVHAPGSRLDGLAAGGEDAAGAKGEELARLIAIGQVAREPGTERQRARARVLAVAPIARGAARARAAELGPRIAIEVSVPAHFGDVLGHFEAPRRAHARPRAPARARAQRPGQLAHESEQHGRVAVLVVAEGRVLKGSVSHRSSVVLNGYQGQSMAYPWQIRGHQRTLRKRVPSARASYRSTMWCR